MSDVINKLAMQFAEQNREDQRYLRGELAGLRHILSAVVAQAGGELVLGDRARMVASPDDTLEFRQDTWNRCLRIRRSGDRPAGRSVVRPAVVSGDRLPDWML